MTDLFCSNNMLNGSISEILRLQKCLNIKQNNLFEQLSLLTRITNAPNLLVTIYNIEKNQFTWFNKTAKKILNIKNENESTISENTYLEKYLTEDHHNFWSCRKLSFLNGRKKSMAGIYTLRFKSKTMLLASQAYVTQTNKAGMATQFADVSLVLHQNLIKRFNTSKYNSISQPGVKMSLLTNREKQIIPLILKGYTSKKISILLNISKHTVQTHRKNIMKKLNIHSVACLGTVVFKGENE